jgi:hypothetical protein
MRIFLGGYPGAGKTSLSQHLVLEHGWSRIDLDPKGTPFVPELLFAPVGHPKFTQAPLVVEGGFLDRAPQYRDLVRRFNLTTFWLTGSRRDLQRSRLERGERWDNPDEILNTDWIGLVDRYRNVVPWNFEIQMWHLEGTRKTFEELVSEIHLCLEGADQTFN